MNIILFSNSCWSVLNFRKNLIKNLKKKYHIIIMAPHDGYEKKLKNLGCKVFDIKIKNNKMNFFYDFFLLIQIFKILYRFKKNSILLNFTIKPLIYGSFIARVLKITCICMITGLGTIFIKKNFITSFVLLLYKFSFKKIAHVFFQNSEDKKIFINNKIITNKNCSLIPGSGVDLKRFQYNKLVKKKVTKFLLIARILKEKGILEYISAARLVKKNNCKIELNLLGAFVENNQSSVSKKIIFEAHKEKIINFIGFRDDVRGEIKKVDCMVLPSYREGTPRSLLEGAAMGRPIITANSTGCKQVVVNGENGYFCKIKDHASLYLKIKKFHNLPFLQKKRMSLNSRRLASKIFDENIVIAAYKDVIQKINLHEVK